MKVLITGGKGQLGLSIKKIAQQYPTINFDFTDIDEIDITKPESIYQYMKDKSFTHVINCAAYTNVDKAEDEKEMAKLLNVTAVGYLSKECAKQNCTLIHISTDYVFDGNNHKPYIETDPVNPNGVYSETKAEGEHAALSNNQKAFVIRTSWLYSEFGNNFLKTILRLATEKDKLTIVDDQIGTPTYATHLAKGIMTFIQNEKKSAVSSIYHFSNEGVASWYDFAYEIVKRTAKKCEVLPISSKTYPLPAPRPHYSLMSKQLFSKTFNYKIPYWKDGLEECLILI